MTESAYPSLTRFEEIFKELVWNNAIDAALAALFAYCPYLNVPPLRQIINGLTKLIANTFFTYLRLVVDLSAIKLVNAEHQTAFDSASVRLRIISYNKGINSPEFLKAKEEAKIALAKFVRFGAAV